MNFWQRLGDMILNGLQVVASTLWGVWWASIGGGLPALAAYGNNHAKYGEAYWLDILPVFVAGAATGVGAYLANNKMRAVAFQKGLRKGRTIKKDA